MRLRVADIRRTNLPHVETLGQLTPLSFNPSQGLAEQVHIQFFANNIAGSEFNFYGPRMSRVSSYLQAKLGLRVKFDLALRASIAEQLQQLREIRLFRLAITPSLLDELGRTDPSVAGMFANAASFGEPQRMEIVLRTRPRSRDSLGGRVREAIGLLANNPAVLEGATIFQTEGRLEDGSLREINLLRDDLRVERQVLRVSGTRELQPASVYAAIESAYAELRQEIEQSHGVWFQHE